MLALLVLRNRFRQFQARLVPLNATRLCRTMGRGQVVRHQVLVLAFGGSNPSAPAKLVNRGEDALICASLLYFANLTPVILGSNPSSLLAQELQ